MGDRVLIVEDEARLREILCDYFSAKGEQPVGAENGQAALDYLREMSGERQILLFTCQEREARHFAGDAGVHIVRL